MIWLKKPRLKNPLQRKLKNPAVALAVAADKKQWLKKRKACSSARMSGYGKRQSPRGRALAAEKSEMEHSIKIGVLFGLTSGVITTLGLMVGLYSGTHSELAVIGGILTIAIADAFSDALGIHVSEESENKHTAKEIWASTLSTFLSKFFFALTFVVPVLLFELSTAVIVSIFWGLFVLTVANFYIGRQKKEGPWGIIAEHLLIAIVVLFAANFAGRLIATLFA
ncbi:MAG: hypothetical protein ABIF92_02515 [archaeon]